MKKSWREADMAIGTVGVAAAADRTLAASQGLGALDPEEWLGPIFVSRRSSCSCCWSPIPSAWRSTFPSRTPSSAAEPLRRPPHFIDLWARRLRQTFQNAFRLLGGRGRRQLFLGISLALLLTSSSVQSG